MTALATGFRCPFRIALEIAAATALTTLILGSLRLPALVVLVLVALLAGFNVLEWLPRLGMVSSSIERRSIGLVGDQ